MRSASLLIIDDDPIHLSTLASTLRLRLPDAQVETAEAALASLKRIRAHEYDAVLCDGHQPGMEGVRSREPCVSFTRRRRCYCSSKKTIRISSGRRWRQGPTMSW